MRQCATDIVAIALKASQDIREDRFVVGARHAIGRTRRDDRGGERAQIADLFGGKAMFLHEIVLSRTGWRDAA
jgi:hypothetical protein